MGSRCFVVTGRDGIPRTEVVEGGEQVRRELAATRADVDDDRGGGGSCSAVHSASRASASTAPVGPCVAVVKCAAGPPRGDVETPPGGIQRVVPGLAPRKGIHAHGL